MHHSRLLLCLSLSLLSACAGNQALEETEVLGQHVEQTQGNVQELREDVDQLALRVDLLEREGRFIKNGAVLTPVPGEVIRGGTADIAELRSGTPGSTALVGPVPGNAAGAQNTTSAMEIQPGTQPGAQAGTHGPQDPLIPTLPILPPGQVATAPANTSGAAASSQVPLSSPNTRPGVDAGGAWSPYSFGVKPNGMGAPAGSGNATASSSSYAQPYAQPPNTPPSAAVNPAGGSTAESLQAMYPSPPVTEQSTYDTALRFYQSGRFKDAEAGFNKFLKEFPKSKLVANALYWRGESYYARSDFRNAIFAFKDVQARYPQHSKTPDSLLKTAMAYDKLGDKENAALHLVVLFEDWPQSEASRRAEKMGLKPR